MKYTNLKPNKATVRIAFETGKLEGFEKCLRILFKKYLKKTMWKKCFDCKGKACNYDKCILVKKLLEKNGFKYLKKR